jgi:hypothetical protein
MMNDFNKEFYIWFRDDDESMVDCYAPYILKVYSEEDRDLVWDLFKSGFAREFFHNEEIKTRFIDWPYYFLYRVQEEYNIDLETISMDVISFDMPLKEE